MKFECEKISIEQELNHSKTINGSKGSYDIYSHILLKLEGSLLNLKVTDGNFCFETCLPVLGYEDGEVLISSEKLLSLLQARSQKYVLFERKEQLLEIKTEKENSKTNVSYLKLANVEELTFPLSKSPSEKNLRILQKRIQKLITQSIYAVSNDENRGALTGVSFKITDSLLKLASTDGNRLAVAQESNISYEDLSLILSAKGLNFIKNLMSGESDCIIRLEENRIFFEFDRYHLSMGLIAGNFPSYETIIPNSQKHQISLSKVEFLESIRMATVLTDQRSKRIFFEFKDSILTISSEESEDGFTSSEISLTENFSEPCRLAFNSDYLQQAIKVIDENEIIFTFSDNKNVCILKSPQEDFLHIIMPMNLD